MSSTPTMAAHSLLALRNILRSVSPAQEQFTSPDPDPAQMSSSSSSESSAAAIADHDLASSSHNLKRPASPTFEGLDEDSRKRAKKNEADADVAPQTNPASDDANTTQAVALPTQPTPSSVLLDDLEQELLCGCCSALIYRPVIVYPCEHYFCGRSVLSLSVSPPPVSLYSTRHPPSAAAPSGSEYVLSGPSPRRHSV